MHAHGHDEAGEIFGGAGRAPSLLSVSRRRLRHRSRVRQHRGMVAVDPRGDPAAQGAALLSSARGELRDGIHRLRLRAEPVARRDTVSRCGIPQVSELFVEDDNGGYPRAVPAITLYSKAHRSCHKTKPPRHEPGRFSLRAKIESERYFLQPGAVEPAASRRARRIKRKVLHLLGLIVLAISC